nr:MAG TPA: nuclease [Caudoviricetes sp.]
MNRVSTGELARINQAMAKAGADAAKKRREQEEQRKKYEEERQKAALEQSRIPNSGGSAWEQYRAAKAAGEVRNASEFIQKRDARNSAWNKIGADTLNDDMEALAKSISSTYGTQFDPSKYYSQETINGSSDQVKKMRDRLNALAEYYNTYGGSDDQKKAVGEQIKAYDSELKFLGDLGAHYGQYKNEADFNYRTDKRRDEDYIVNDYDAEAGKKNLAELKGYLDRINTSSDSLSTGQLISNARSGKKAYNRTAINEAKQQYGLDGMTDDEVLNWLTQEYQLESFALNNVDRMRTAAGYRNLANNDDFLQGVISGKAVENPTFEDYLNYENAATQKRAEAYNKRKASDPILTAEDTKGQDAPSIVNKLRFYEDLTNDKYGNKTDSTTVWSSDLGAAKRDALGYHYGLMTDDEKRVYYYLLGTQGKEAADKYLEDMDVTLDYRNTEEVKQFVRDLKNSKIFGNVSAAALANTFGGLGGAALGYLIADSNEGINKTAGDIAYSAASVPANVIGGGISTAGEIGQRLDLASKGDWEGKGYNPYENYNLFSVAGREARGLVAKDIEDSIGWKMFGQNVMSQVYQSLMSGVDSAFGMATLGKLYTISMGGSAAASKAAELYESGASSSQIYWESLLSGIAEATFEYLSIENLSSIRNIVESKPATPKIALKMILTQNGIEASEEVFTEIANMVIDKGIKKYDSDYDRKVTEYVRDGMTREEAVKKAAGEVAADIGWAGAGGFISGLASSSLTIAGAYRAGKANADAQISAIDPGNAEGLYNNAKKIDYSILNDASDALKKGDAKAAAEIISEGKDWYEYLKSYAKEKYGKNQASEISANIDTSIDNLNQIKNLISSGDINADSIQAVLEKAKSAQDTKVDLTSANDEKLFSLLAKGEPSNSVIEKNILKDRGTLAAFERLTGLRIGGTTVSQKRADVREAFKAVSSSTETLKAAQNAIESGATATEGHKNAAVIIDQAIQANRAENSRLRNSEKVKSAETKAAIDATNRQHRFLETVRNYVINGGDLSGFTESPVSNVSGEGGTNSSETKTTQETAKKRVRADFSAYQDERYSAENASALANLNSKAEQDAFFRNENAGIEQEIKNIESSDSITAEEKAQRIGELKETVSRNNSLAKAMDDFREMGRLVRAGEVDEVVDSLRKPLKKMGVNIEVVDNVEAADGMKSGAYFDKNTNTIKVSRDWNGVENVVKLELAADGNGFVLNSGKGVSFDRAVTQTIAHEIAHADSGLTLDFIKAVAGTQYDAFDLKGRLEHPDDRSWKSEDAQKEENWRRYVDAYTEQAMLDMKGTEEQRRASAEKVVNDAYIFEEIMADMFGAAVDDMGHSSRAGENIFWAMNRNKPGIIKRILNALERFIARIRGKDAYLAVEQRQAAERLRDMLTGELKRAYGTEVKGEAAVENDGGKKYSIVYLDDGKTYVTASRNVISGNDVNQWRKQITNFFNALLEGNKSIDIETVEGDTLTITKKETARKARDNFKQENGKPVRMSDSEFRVKLNVEAHIDEIAETARSSKNTGSADTKSHAFAKDGFTYRTAYFEDFNGDYYRVRLSIGNNGTVATVYNVGKMTKDVPASAKILAVVGSKPLAVTSSDNSISQDSRNVNRQFSEISDAKVIEETTERLNEVSKPEKRFSLSSNVEQTKDLIAVHNMTAAELEKSLDLGGLPMPSIAIIKAADGHSEYGDVSLVFGKDTIDPKKSARNKVYGGDAWTPTFPKIDYKANEKVGKRIRDKYYDLSRKYGYDNTRALYNYAQDLSDVLTSEGGEKAMIDKLYGDTGMMQIYLMDTGRERIANVNKETKTALTDGQVRQYENLIDTLGRDEMNGFAKKDGEELSDLVRRRKAFIEENEAGIRRAFEKTFIEDGMSAKDAAEVSAELALSDLRKYVLDTFNYIKNGAETVKTEFDSEATNAAIKKAADGEGYRKWVNDLFGGAEEKSGIRNSKDAYTASGNRRSFEALHWEHNLENIVKAMLEQDETGGAFFSGMGIWGVSAKKYNSISEIKNDSSRLRTMNEAEYNALKEQYGARMQEIAQTLIDPKNDNYFIASDDAYSLIVDAVRNSKDESGILRYLKKYNSRATEKTASDIAALVRDIAEMPTGYFEAKPQRAVGFDEVKAVILPDNASGELVSRLESDGINTVTYKAGDENSRLEALNGVENVRFSLARANDEYMKAVESGNVEEQQRLVDEAAKANGYDRLFWHGSKKGGGFTEFRDWSYFTENKKYASRYAKPGDNSSLYEVYANLGNAFDTRKPECREIFDKMRSEYGLSKVQESGLPDWTDGYDIAEFIDENGLDYDSIILDEGGDLVDGKPVSRGFSYVIRSSEQVKSADPITYDDSGNVIPLTERFDSGNRDIRWSLAGTNKDGIEVYETSDNIKNLTNKERMKRFEDIMKDDYRGRTAKFIRNGHAYYATFEDTDVKKNIYGDKQSSAGGWKAKIRAGADGDIFELVENAEYDRSSAEQGKSNSAHKGINFWDYYVKTVQIDNEVYDLLANVRRNGDDSYVYNIRLYQNKKIKASPPIGIQTNSVKSGAQRSDNSVSQNDPVVNTQSMQGIEKDSSDERHSLVKSAQSELKALQKENEKLRQDVDDLKQELQLTHGRKLSRDALISSIQKILIDRYGVKLSAKELYPHVTNLYDMLYNNTVDGKRLKKGESVDTMRIIEEMDKIVDAVIENAVGVDDTYVEMKKLLPELRNTKLVVPMDARADAAQSAGFENWAEFRKANFGRVGFANEGLPVDTYYMELSERYPELFPDGITNPGEQAAHIADVVNTIRESGINEYQLYDIEDERIRTSIKNDVMDIIGNAEKLQTFADRAAQKVEDTKLAEAMHYGADIAKLKRLNAEKVAGIKAENQKRLADMRRKYQDRVESVRERYAEARANRSEKQKQTVLRNKVLRKYTEASSMLDRPTTENHFTEAMRKPLMEFLAAVDITTGKSVAKQGVYDRILSVIKAANNMAAEDGKNGLDIAETDLNVQEKQLIVDSGLLERMSAWIKANQGKKLTELSSAQLEELNGIFNQLKHLTAEIKRLYDPREGLAAKSWQAQKEIGLAQTKEREQVLGANTERARGMYEQVHFGALDPSGYYNTLGSDTMTAQFERFRQCQNRFSENIQMFTDRLGEIVDGAIPKDEHGKNAKEVTLKLSRGTLTATPAQLMSIHLMLNQEDSRRCLFNEAGGVIIGKFTAEKPKDGKAHIAGKRTFAQSGRLVLNEADAAKITAALTDGQRKRADAISALLNNEAARLGNEVSMAMYGYKKYTTENYFPMRTADDYRAIADNPNYEMNLLGLSFTKERTGRAGKALVAEDIYDVIGRHLTNMAQYNAFAQELDNAKKMYSLRLGDGTSLKQRIIRSYGREADAFYNKLINNLSGVQMYTNNSAEALSDKLLSNYKAAAVAGNVSVVLKQPMSIFRALPEFSLAGLKKSMAFEDILNLSPKQLKANTAEMLKYSGIARLKAWGSSENMTRKSFESLYNDNSDTARQKINEFLTSGAENADMWTWAKLWRMSKAEIDAQNKYTKGSKEYFEAVDRKFSDVIGKTQVVQSALDSSMAVQNAKGFGKFLFAFQNEPLKQYSYLISTLNDARRGKPGAKKKLAKVIASSLANTAAVSAISTFMAWLRGTLDRDDDDELLDDLMKEFAGNSIDDLLSGAFAPVWQYIDTIMGAINSGVYGNTVERLDMAALTDLGGLINKYFISQNGGRPNLGTVQDIVNVASNLFGLPAKNIFRDVKSVIDRIILELPVPSAAKYNYLKAWKDVELTNKAAVTEAYYDVLRDAVDRGRYSDYVKIKRDMIYHGYTETKIKNAVMKSSLMDDLYELKKVNPGSYKAKVNSIVSSVSAVSGLEGKEFEDFIESAMKRREREDGGSKTDDEVYDEMHRKMEKEVKEQLIYIDVSKRAAYIKKMLKTYGEYGITEADILKVLRKAGKA